MKNLLYNGDFELWTYPNSAPDGWSLNGINALVSRYPLDCKEGSYSAILTNGTNGGNLLQYISSAGNVDTWKNRNVAVGCWVKSSIANKGCIRLYDGGFATPSYTHHTGGGEWEWMTGTITVSNSATSLRCYIDSETSSGSNLFYFDGAVALEGCWVPQTPYDFEDVEFRLGPTSATSIPLYPEEGMELGKYLMHNTQRAADGHLYGYEFGTYHKSSFPVEYMPASDAAIVNSWWESQAKLLLFVTSGPVTAVYSCMIMGDNCPMCQVSKPYDDRFKGTIQLEGY